MATITAVLTEDFKRYYPQFLGGLAGMGVAESDTVYANQTIQVGDGALAVGDVFWHASVLKRKVTVTGSPPAAGNTWVQTLSTGVVDPVTSTDVVTCQRRFTLMQTIKSFKVGEGGWIDMGGGTVPRTPDATLRRLTDNVQDVDALVDNTRTGGAVRYALNSRFAFEKDLVSGSPTFTFVAPNKLRVRCRLEPADYPGLGDGFGNDPSLWEIGLFTENPMIIGERLMICYGTFPEQVWTNAVTLDNYVEVIFS